MNKKNNELLDLELRHSNLTYLLENGCGCYKFYGKSRGEILSELEELEGLIEEIADKETTDELLPRRNRHA